MKDNHGRDINYLRLAVTDKCNLRCYYCMPEAGLDWLPRKELMTNKEMLQTCALLVDMGIEKIRITGGEPFIRKDLMPFLSDLSQLKGLKELTLTTNGILIKPFIPELKQLGIKSVNLSLDSLDRNKFFSITRRDELPIVLESLESLLDHQIHTKINAVVMAGKNTDDIIPLVQLTKDQNIDVRFIEEMPFNGAGIHINSVEWNHVKILETIKSTFPSIKKIPDPPYSTSYNYQIPGHKGTIGIIAAYTRSFCGTCNRIRITPLGQMKTCLYGEGVLNIKELLRKGESEKSIKNLLLQSFNSRAIDGWEAERARNEMVPVHESMATIGG